MTYGIELEDSDMEEYGLMAWDYIGNKNRKLYNGMIQCQLYCYNK